MKDEDKTKAELIKKLKTLRKERGKSTLNDLTERKQTEQVIQESESRFRELFNYMSSGVAIYEAKNNGRDFIFRSFNRAAEKIDKVKKGDIVGKSVLKVFPGVKDFGLFKIFQEVYKTGKPQRHPISRYKDQRITGWRENYVYKLPSGEIAAIYDDITERKKAEEQIKDSEERLKILFDYAPDAYYISDLKGNFIDGNIAAERVIGYKREELIGSSFLKLKLLSLADAAKAAELLVKNLRGQPAGPDEFVLNRKDKSKVTVEISTYPVKIKGKTLALGIARDITERKQAEEELRRSEARLNESQRLTKIGNWELDLITNTLYWSDEIYRMFNLESQQFGATYEAFLDNIHPDDRAFVDRAYIESVKSNTPYDIVHRLLSKDGTVKFVNEHCKTFYDDAGKAVRSIGTIQDITERKQAEERLKKNMDATIETVSKIIEVRDPYTAGHQKNVSQVAVFIAQEMKLPKDKIEGIRIASLVHDIGKISVPAEILNKPIKLNEMEFNLIKVHSQTGYDILKSIDFSYPIAQIVLQHHERLNGSGYPNKLKGDKILPEAKIIGVADVVEAMSSHRPYRPALGIDAALEEISKNKGILYDPEVVDSCIKLFKEKRI